MISKIQSYLLSCKDEKYLDFNSSIIGETRYPLIGVRIPQLRSYAKKLLKEDDVVFKDEYFEEVLLHGLYIGSYRCSFPEKIGMIDEFLPLIDNWAICDSFVSSLKDIGKNRKAYYPYVKRYLKNKEEFIKRYALVVLLNYYLEDEYIEDLKKIVSKKYDQYYTYMAAGWLLSYMFMRDFEDTYEFVKNTKLDENVRKTGIRKALDSRQIIDDNKLRLRSL